MWFGLKVVRFAMGFRVGNLGLKELGLRPMMVVVAVWSTDVVAFGKRLESSSVLETWFRSMNSELNVNCSVWMYWLQAMCMNGCSDKSK